MVYNATGQLCCTLNTNDGNTINTLAWANGIYFVRTENEEGISFSKLIKE
jgi:hypothetical protein